MRGRKEANREALVQKNRTLLAKSIQSSRKRSAVNSVPNYVGEVSTARKDELITHTRVGRIEVAFDGTLPLHKHSVSPLTKKVRDLYEMVLILR